MSRYQTNNSPPPSSISFSILDLKAQSVRLPVSKGAQILLSELLTWSGERGFCWWGVRAIAKDLSWSVSSVWRRATELKEASFLAVVPRPGRSNYWIPLPGPAKMERLKSELAPLANPRGPILKENRKIKRCTVINPGTSTDQAPPSPRPNVNAINICSEKAAPLTGTNPDESLEPVQEQFIIVQSPLQSKPIQQKPVPVEIPKSTNKTPITPDHLFLLQEIERVTQDTWSRGHFINLVRQNDEHTIYAALSVTREKRSLESGVNLGAYFTATLKGMKGLAGLGKESSGASINQQHRLPHISPESPLARPTPQLLRAKESEPEPVDPDALKKGWRFHYKGSGVQGVLSLVQRCMPVSVDVRGLWVDVRETFPGVEERILIERLLDTVVTRMRHAEKMAETRA